MVWQSFFSLVRLMALGLLSLSVFACTAQHTRELGRKTLQDMGLERSVRISRSGSWALPAGTPVYVAPVYVVGADQELYPRLRGQLNQMLEALLAEGFSPRAAPADSNGGPGAGVLLRVGLAGVTEQLSSVHEMTDRGVSDQTSGHDRLRLVMKLYDMRTGQLLDTLNAEAISGWRWKEHQVAQLAEPTLRAMLAQLRSAQVGAVAE